MAIDAKEAAMMANAIDAVQQHYGFDVPEHYAIWINLVTAFGTVYVPRIVSISARKSKERRGAQPKPQHPFAPAQPEKAKPQAAPDNMPWTTSLPGMHAPLEG